MKYFAKRHEDKTINSNYEPLKSFGVTMPVEVAPEPSNIVWENLEISDYNIRRNEFRVYFLISAVLIAIFFMSLGIKAITNQNMEKYPLRTKCDAIMSLFAKNDKLDMEYFRKYAQIDMRATLKGGGAGFYQCFC